VSTWTVSRWLEDGLARRALSVVPDPDEPDGPDIPADDEGIQHALRLEDAARALDSDTSFLRRYERRSSRSRLDAGARMSAHGFRVTNEREADENRDVPR
jgi:hypothetical protein